MVTIFWAIYFQNILGLTPLTVGTVAVASNFPVIIFAPLGGYMLDKYGPRIPISLGFVLLILSLLWFSFFTKNENILYLLPGLVPLGCGVPLIFSPCFTTAMSSVPSSQRGAASGISTTFRQFAATLGMAVIGTLFIYSEQNHLTKLFAENSSIRNFSPSDFEGLLSQAPGAVAALSKLPYDIAQLIRREYANAFESAFSFINFVASGIAVLGLLCGIIFMTKELKEPEPVHDD
jgi:DHA2 family multidrug resistance protein-like MFS transporter